MTEPQTTKSPHPTGESRGQIDTMNQHGKPEDAQARGTLTTNEELTQAFVDGAKFWEWHKSGATMWQSDQDLCLERAKEKYEVKNAKA